MTTTSVQGLQMDSKLYNQVVSAYRNGNKNELIRLVLEQYNWAMRLSHQAENTLTYNQSVKLTVLYITLAKIANAITGRGEYNLSDTRTNEVIGHRGWYLHDYILKDIVEKALPEMGNVRQMFAKGQAFLSPEYGVIQSIVTAQDLRKWSDMYKTKTFNSKDTNPDSFFADAQQLFRNIDSGRSVMFLTNDGVRALTEFTEIFADEKNPAYRAEYEPAINSAIHTVNREIAEFNNAMQANSAEKDR